MTEASQQTDNHANATETTRMEKPQQQPKQKAHWYSIFGNVAQIASAMIALFGFTAVAYQISISRDRATSESLRAELGEARKVYMSYSEATLRYPEFTAPNYDELMSNHLEYVRYQNFVAHMLWAYDEILNAISEYQDTEDLDEWLVGFDIDLESHQRYLCSIRDPRVFKMYRVDMQNRIAERNAANCKDMQPLVEKKLP
jgi:hypothetical protein